MKHPTMRIICRQKAVLPIEDFVSYIWKVIGNKDFLELEATSTHPAVELYQVLTLWPKNLLSDHGCWLIICKDGDQLVRYDFWQESNQLLLQRR